jgi:hypothetical protein
MHAHILFINCNFESMERLYMSAGALLTPSAHLPKLTCAVRPANRTQTRIAARPPRDVDLSFSAPQTEEITSLQNATGA